MKRLVQTQIGAIFTTLGFCCGLLIGACCHAPRTVEVPVPIPMRCMDPPPVIGLAPFPRNPDPTDGTYHVPEQTAVALVVELFYLEAQLAKCGPLPTSRPSP